MPNMCRDEQPKNGSTLVERREVARHRARGSEAAEHGKDDDASCWSIVYLGEHDLARLRQTNVLFANAFEDPDRYSGQPPSDAHLTALLKRPEFIALAAIENGTVVGALTAYELVKYERATSQIYIFDLAVDEGWRRRRIATDLISRVRDIAASRGAETIFVQADLDDEPAIALYTGLGKRQDVHHFDIPIEMSPRRPRGRNSEAEDPPHSK